MCAIPYLAASSLNQAPLLVLVAWGQHEVTGHGLLGGVKWVGDWEGEGHGFQQGVQKDPQQVPSPQWGQ